MNTLFPYNPPDPQKIRALKKTLIKEHQLLYGGRKYTWRSWVFVPSLLLLLLFCSVSSLVVVEAFSPAAQLYGKLYGVAAQLSFASSKILSTTNAALTPTLPGLTKEETATFGNQSGSGQIYLQSKIARTLPKELQNKIIVPEILPLGKLPALHTSQDSNGVVTLQWEEATLASGALPAGYVIFSSTDQQTWNKRATTTATKYAETITTSTWYRISIMDWQDQLLPQSMETFVNREHKNTSTTAPTNIPPKEEPQKNIVHAPAYDHTDDILPRATVQLTMKLRVSGTSIGLSWNSIPEAQGYNIYRDALKHNTTPLSTTSFLDSTVLPGKTYQYQIRAVDTAGKEISASEKISERIPIIPKGPSNLQGSVQNGTIVLTWNDVAVSDKEGYALVRTSVHSSKKTHTTPTTTFVDSNTTSGEEYTYTVYTLMKDGVRSKEYATITISIP